jgi:hypothetical protein
VAGDWVGLLIVERNINLMSQSQGVFIGGGVATGGKGNLRLRNNIMYAANNASQFYYWATTTFDAENNTVIWNIKSASFDLSKVPGFVNNGANTNLNFRDNLTHRFDTPTGSGTVINPGTSNTVSGDNAILANNIAAYLDKFVNVMYDAGNPSAIVDMDALTIGLTTYDAAKALGLFYAIPKNLLTSSSGLKRADGTGPGALKPNGGYNTVGAAW